MLLNRLAALRGGALLFLLAYGIVWVVLPVAFNAGLPNDTIEIIAWGREWLVGLYRHPPMKTWLMELFFQASGGWGGSAYVLSAAAFAVAQLALHAAIRDVRPRTFAFAAVAMGGLVYHLGGQLPQWNANIAQLPFAGLFVLGLWRALDRGGLSWWLLAGAAAAGGFLSKYTFALIPMAVAALALADPWMRQRIRLVPAAAGVVATVVLIAPNLWWFLTHPELVAEGVAFNERLRTGDWMDHVVSPLLVIGATIGVAILPAIAVFFGLAGGESTGADLRLRKLRAILAAALFGPIAFFAVSTGATGSGFKDHWLIAFFFFLPSWLLLARWGRHAAVAWTGRGTVFLLAALAVLAAIFAVERVRPYWVADGRPVTRGVLMPPAPLAEAVAETWQQGLEAAGLPTDMPIAVVGGEFAAAAVAAELPERPAWYESLNPLRSPWVTPDMLRRDGIVVVESHDALKLLELGLCRAATRDYDWLNARGGMGFTVTIEAWVPASTCPGG